MEGGGGFQQVSLWNPGEGKLDIHVINNGLKQVNPLIKL